MRVFSIVAASLLHSAAGIALLAAPIGLRAAEEADLRVPIALTAPEQNYVLGNMRLHLADVELIVSALGRNDAAGAQAAAAHLGTRSFEGSLKRPASLLPKLPPEFLHLTKAYHAQFDDLAEGISRGDPTAQSLQRLGVAMQSCVACHSTFRIAAP
jgi:hypothetical protein